MWNSIMMPSLLLHHRKVAEILKSMHVQTNIRCNHFCVFHSLKRLCSSRSSQQSETISVFNLYEMKNYGFDQWRVERCLLKICDCTVYCTYWTIVENGMQLFEKNLRINNIYTSIYTYLDNFMVNRENFSTCVHWI